MRRVLTSLLVVAAFAAASDSALAASASCGLPDTKPLETVFPRLRVQSFMSTGAP